MSFIWVQTIAQGAAIDRADIMEIRDNTDWLDGNIVYCASHNSTYQATYCATDRVTHYSVNNSAHVSSAQYPAYFSDKTYEY